jgi:hypothetical protein
MQPQQKSQTVAFVSPLLIQGGTGAVEAFLIDLAEVEQAYIFEETWKSPNNVYFFQKNHVHTTGAPTLTIAPQIVEV